jgi:hypothetical protein
MRNIVALLLVLSGCTVKAPVTHFQPHRAASVVMCVDDPSMQDYANDWRTEVSRRFDNAVVVLCHGTYTLDDTWYIYDRPGTEHPFDSVQKVVAETKARYPGRVIVLLCCNVSHTSLHGMPGVWYAPAEVWLVPDRSVPMFDRSAVTLDGPLPEDNTVTNRSVGAPEAVGNIFEFQEAN